MARDRTERKESPKLSSLHKQDTTTRCFVILKPTTQHPPTSRRIPEAEGADMTGMDEIMRMLMKIKKSAAEKHKNNWIHMEAM
jgi:hypothetical protein